MGIVWRLGLPLEAGFDRVRRRMRRRAAERNGVQIVPYAGFGNGEMVRIKGRVLRATQAGKHFHD